MNPVKERRHVKKLTNVKHVKKGRKRFVAELALSSIQRLENFKIWTLTSFTLFSKLDNMLSL